MKILKKLIYTVLFMSGFIPKNMTFTRSLFMFGSLAFSIFLLPKYKELNYAIIYFLLSTIIYFSFLFCVLSKGGFKTKLIKKFGEEKAYSYYEGLLGFIFFHNGVALVFISQSSAGTSLWNSFPLAITIALFSILFIGGFVVKIWSAYIAGASIYYLKDLFLGRKISEFIVSGPYKYFSNPMYGVGQLQVYAIAIYYNSTYGLIFAAINQFLMFLFYYVVEKPFVKETYLAFKNS